MSRESITRIKVVYDALEELANEVVFVGGATVALYADRPSGEARPTDDVDIHLDPKTVWENKKDKKNPFFEKNEERRLSKSNLDRFFPDLHGLGSPAEYDDYSDESHP